jgi:Cu(I)/Ag(I) efflux system membrane fusion protein
MERPFVTPLPPHRGRHAGILSAGLLVATTTFVWVSDDPGPSKVDPRPVPAASMPQAPEPPRFEPIELGPEIITVVATERELTRVITASGALTFDNSRTNHLRTPVAGVFVKTRPSSLGRVVRAGETVGVVYSLEVFVATSNLLAELREFRGQEHVDHERWRLLRWGMRREQLRQIEESMKPSAALPIIARVTGKVVTEVEGGRRELIDPSIGDLMTITDPSYATIYVEVPVADAELLAVGQATRVTLPGLTRPFAAPIGYVAQSADDGTKIVRVDLHPVRLKTPPATWREIEAKIELARVIARGPAVPVAAVVRSGERTFVYVVRGEVAEPRDVRLGPAADGYVSIEGIAIGETIAIR